MLKILQAKLQEYVYHKIIDIQAGFKKAEEPEINCQHPLDHWKREQESSRKTSTSAVLTMAKPLSVWITKNWKIICEMGISDHLTASWETCIQEKKQQLEADID